DARISRFPARRAVWTLLAVLCFAVIPATRAQDPEQKGVDEGNYNIKQSIEFGGRLTSISGNDQVYNTFVNLHGGPRLLGFTMEMRSLDHHATLFDRFFLTSFGYGGDPNQTSRLRMSKNKWYNFDASFRRDENFWDYSLQANPLNPTAAPPNAPAGFNPQFNAPAFVRNPSIIALSPHLMNTRRKLGDYNLVALPQGR